VRLAALSAQNGALLIVAGVADLDAHEKAVELALREGVGALLLGWVLGRDHHERVGQRHGLPVHRDLAFAHRLQQRTLRLGRGAVDLVGQ